MTSQHIVAEDIDAVMRSGLAVYDASGQRIGHVKDYSNVAGYLVALGGPFAHEELYVPYSAIKSIDAREIFLNLDKDTLARQHTAPPQATIVADDRSTAAVVPDGYDGTPATVNRVDLEMVKRDLAKGMAIYATYGDKIGTVDAIDEQAGYLVVKRSHPHEHNFFIPFAVISSIDRWFPPPFGTLGPLVVYLFVSRDILVKEYTQLPDGVVLHTDAA